MAKSFVPKPLSRSKGAAICGEGYGLLFISSSVEEEYSILLEGVCSDDSILSKDVGTAFGQVYFTFSINQLRSRDEVCI